MDLHFYNLSKQGENIDLMQIYVENYVHRCYKGPYIGVCIKHPDFLQ
jgi:hypothetical protein